MGARSEASGAFKCTAVGQSKSTVSLFLMLVRLESSPKYIPHLRGAVPSRGRGEGWP
jgi:hypothetical protein